MTKDQELPSTQSHGNIRETYRLTEIPTSWFLGFGRVDGGIRSVAYSNSLTELRDGLVGSYLSNWGHYKGNPIRPNDSEERRLRAQAEMAEAEEFVAQVTGFTIDDLNSKKNRLTKQYRGKFKAPFEVELY